MPPMKTENPCHNSAKFSVSPTWPHAIPYHTDDPSIKSSHACLRRAVEKIEEANEQQELAVCLTVCACVHAVLTNLSTHVCARTRVCMFVLCVCVFLCARLGVRVSMNY